MTSLIGTPTITPNRPHLDQIWTIWSVLSQEERHCTFSNLVLKGKLWEALQFVCEIEKGGVLQPDELATHCMGKINKTVILVLEGKHPSETIPPCATSEMYEETPIFIPFNITEEAVESVEAP